jgi:hypothetical protein
MEILSALRSGPKTASELLKLVAISKRTLYKQLNSLEKDEQILVFPLRIEDRWTSLYSLPEHSELARAISGYSPVSKVLPDLSKKIKDSIEKLREKLFRNPEVEEIAIDIGENPEDEKIRDSIYQVGFQMGWRPPTREERERAEKELKEIIMLADMIKKGYSIHLVPEEQVEKAKEYLKRVGEG